MTIAKAEHEEGMAMFARVHAGAEFQDWYKKKEQEKEDKGTDHELIRFEPPLVLYVDYVETLSQKKVYNPNQENKDKLTDHELIRFGTHLLVDVCFGEFLSHT